MKVHSSLQACGIQYDDQRRQLSLQEAGQLHPAHHPLLRHLQFTQVFRQVSSMKYQQKFR